jgi:hypothetical protein
MLTTEYSIHLREKQQQDDNVVQIRGSESSEACGDGGDQIVHKCDYPDSLAGMIGIVLEVHRYSCVLRNIVTKPPVY